MTKDRYLEQFGPDFDFANAGKPMKTLIIASTPRCGSHYIGHALQATGQFGSPFEYANVQNLERWQRKLDTLGIKPTMDALMQRRTSPNGVFAIKVHWTHLVQFGGLDGLLRQFPDPRLFYLRRRDLLSQAISFAIAQQDGVWFSGQLGNGRIAEYDFLRIYRCLYILADQNAFWQAAITCSATPSDAMDFEDVRLDLPAAVQRVANLMDVAITVNADNVSERTERQSSTRNSEWRSRFIEDMAAKRERSGRSLIDLRRAASLAKRAISRR